VAVRAVLPLLAVQVEAAHFAVEDGLGARRRRQGPIGGGGMRGSEGAVHGADGPRQAIGARAAGLVGVIIVGRPPGREELRRRRGLVLGRRRRPRPMRLGVERIRVGVGVQDGQRVVVAEVRLVQAGRSHSGRRGRGGRQSRLMVRRREAVERVVVLNQRMLLLSLQGGAPFDGHRFHLAAVRAILLAPAVGAGRRARAARAGRTWRGAGHVIDAAAVSLQQIGELANSGRGVRAAAVGRPNGLDRLLGAGLR